MSPTSSHASRSERVTPRLQWSNGTSKPCQVCSIEITSAEHWMEHIKKHQGQLRNESEYHCPLCARTCTSWRPLVLHMGRHFPGYKPYECKELIQVADPHNPTSYTMVQCSHRDVDPSRINLHRVKCHGHQRKKRSSKASDESSSCGHSTRTPSEGRAARRAAPYQASATRTRATSQVHSESESSESSYASSSSLTLDTPQYPLDCTPYYNCATPDYSSASSPVSTTSSRSASPSYYYIPSPTYSGATSPSPSPSPLSPYYNLSSPDYPVAVSPTRADSPWASTPFSAPSPTFSGATSPSPSPSPSYPWDAPSPSSPPVCDGLSFAAQGEVQTLDDLDIWLVGLTPEARQLLDEADRVLANMPSIAYAFS